MISPSSSSPLLAISGDNLFRLCPNDLVQAPVIAKMLWNWGIEAIIVIQRGDPWADGLYNILEKEYPKLGGKILARVRYAAEVTEFSSYLERMEEIARDAVEEYGKEHVAIQCFSFSEIVTIVTQAKDYPTIYNLMWFGSDGTAFTQQLIDDAPEQADKLKILSTLAAPIPSSKYFDLYERYYELTNTPLSYYTAALYDIAWIYALSIIEAASTETDAIRQILPYVAENYFGVTGWCKLDVNGDRETSNYDIWGYAIIDGKCYNVKYGIYDSLKDTITWYDVAITPEGLETKGLTPPGHS